MTSSKSLEKNREDLKRKAAIDALWRKGIVHWKLDNNQLEMRDFALHNNDKIIVIASSRQVGKSYYLCALALELCLQNPNYTIKYVAPKIKDIKNVVLNHIRDITQDCPKELIPKYKTNEGCFYFANGSMIQLAAAENGHIDGIRGTRAHMCIVDEAGFCSDLDYAINSVLLPTTTTTNGKIIIASTPARTPDHDFVKIMNDAEADGRLIRKTIYDNPRLTPEQIEEFARACGGKHTVQFRREYLAENIISEEDAVVPEFTQELETRIVKDWTRPAFYDAYEAMDIGGRDGTAVLFGYYDFQAAKLVLVDEIILRGKDVITDNLATLIKEREDAHYKHPATGEVKQPYLRIADNNNIILLNDLNTKHGLVFTPTLKDNKEAAINNMRLMLKDERIIISPRCKTLISHLKSAVWKKNGKEFARSSDKGHYDMVDALVYLCRNVNQQHNPFPQGYSFMGVKDVFSPEISSKATTPFEKSMEETFKVKKIGVRRRF